MGYLKKFFAQSLANQGHILLVTGAAVFYRLAIVCLPRRVVYSWLGHYRGRAIFCVGVASSKLRQAQRIGRFVENICNKLPLINASCLIQTLVMRRYLNKYQIPYVIHVGLAKKYQNNTMKLSAHAWVCVGPLVVIGGKFFHEFKVVSTYVPDMLKELPLVSSKLD